MSRAWADNSNDVSHLTISQVKYLLTLMPTGEVISDPHYLKGSTAGQNLNSNTFLTARCLMLQTSFNSQGIIFNAKQWQMTKKYMS